MICSCVFVVFRIFMLIPLLLPKHGFSTRAQFFSCVRSRSEVGHLIDCSTLAGGEKGVELVASGGQRKRVCTPFCRDASELLHRLRVERVHDPWVTNGHVEAA